MTINNNLFRNLTMIFVAGAGGGFVSQIISNALFKKKQLEADKAHREQLEAVRNGISEDLRRAAHISVEQAFTDVIKEDIQAYTETKLHAMDIPAIVNEGISKCVDRIGEEAKEDLKKEARKILMEGMEELAKNTVDEYVKEDMYKVNTRRIVEDAVARLVPTQNYGLGYVKDSVLSKLSGDQLRDILDDPYSSYRLNELLKVTK